MSVRTLEWLKEVLTDASESPRLTEWENKFVQDMLDRLEVFGSRLPEVFGSRLTLTDKQWAVMELIEEKVYR